MHINFTKHLLNFKDKDLIITNTYINNDKYYIDVEYKKGYHDCPKCGNKTSKVHDYSNRIIKHGVINGYFGIINYRRRRYVCKCCNTRFPEPNTFVYRYAKISNLNNDLIIKKFNEINNFKTIAKDLWNVHTFLNSFRIDIAIPVINGRHIAQTAM